MIPAESIWFDTLSHLRDIVIAYVLALPLGWDREKEERSAGLRTFPLVAIASCGFALLGTSVLGKGSMAQGYVLQGLIVGIGFIGAGAIIKRPGETYGTATAACLWITGAVGAAVGFGLYDIAIMLSVAAFFTLRTLAPFKKGTRNEEEEEL